MGEVKSTLEIALEKAKRIEISADERMHFKREEILSAARAVFRLYTDHPRRSDDLAQAIKDAGKNAALFRDCLIEVFLEALHPAHPIEGIWEGLQELGLSDPPHFRASLDRIAEDDERSRREESRKLEDVLRESLARAGISGTAVQPHIADTADWKETLQRLDQKLSAAIEGLRQDIARSIGRRNSSPR
jgi:hypothetical protein